MTEDDGLQKFLGVAAGHRLLTAPEEKALGKRIQAGDRDARNELVLCNIRLIVSVARYYRARGLPMEDVIQNGYIGLNRAAEKYDPSLDIRFSTYATLWIKQAIQRGLTNGGAAIRLPSTVAGTRAKVRAAMTKNPDADHEFIADLLEIDPAEVRRVIEAAEVVTSLDRVIATDEHEHTLLDAMPDEFAPDPADVEDDLSDELRAALDALERATDGSGKTKKTGKQHRKVIEMHFGLTGKPPMAVSEIVAKTGLSANTVKTLRAEAIEFLGHRLDHHK